jgi:hypothetical protein
VRLDHETVWLTQEQMSQLFARERSVITKHVRNVFREGELDPEATCAKFAQVQTEGERTVTREVDHYNLDLIILRRLSGQIQPGHTLSQNSLHDHA